MLPTNKGIAHDSGTQRLQPQRQRVDELVWLSSLQAPLARVQTPSWVLKYLMMPRGASLLEAFCAPEIAQVRRGRHGDHVRTTVPVLLFRARTM
jgi:hypothetical protein